MFEQRFRALQLVQGLTESANPKGQRFLCVFTLYVSVNYSKIPSKFEESQSVLVRKNNFP